MPYSPRTSLEVIGHRGAAARAPENTRAGFDWAIQIGVDAIETDVRATVDGKLVLLHDERVDRTTNGSGAIQTLPWSEVEKLDAGSRFDPRYAGERIPLLAEILKEYGSRIPWVLEIKQAGIENAVLDLIAQSGELRAITYTSFQFEIASNVKRISPGSKVGFLTAQFDDETVERVLDAGLDQFCPNAATVTAERVEAWHAKGLEIRAWGVKTEELMHAAVAAGVDGMTVDFPDLLLRALGRNK